MKLSLSMFISCLFLLKNVSVRGRQSIRSFGFAKSLLSLSVISPSSNSTEINKTLKEETVYSGFRNIVKRTVRLQNNRIVEFDILKQKHESVVVFSWDSRTKTTALVEEFHPGPEVSLYGTVAGMYEKEKHSSPFECAQHELEEEAQLETRHWIPLLGTKTTGMPFDKYSNNKFYPFLALDCEPVANPKPMDDDECIIVHKNVTYQQIMKLIAEGKMNVVSTYTILLAFRKMDELGIDYK